MDKLTEQNIVAEYKNGCSTKKLAKKYHTSAYKIKDVLLENGIDIHTPNRGFGPKQNKPKGWWDVKEHCEEFASKCRNRREMNEKSSAAFKAASKHGWLDEFSEKYFDSQYHFPSLEAHIHLVYAYEVEETHSVYVGRTTDFKRRDTAHRSAKNNDSIYQHCKNENIEIPEPIILEEKLTAKESQISEGKWVEKYTELGWNIINRAKTGYGSGSLGTINPMWNYETCKEAAKLCTSREEFKKKYSRAHNVSRANNWIDEFFPNLMKRKDGCFETLEQCKEACSEFKTIMQIRNEYPFLYHKISKNKWTEEIRNFIGEDDEARRSYRAKMKENKK